MFVSLWSELVPSSLEQTWPQGRVALETWLGWDVTVRKSRHPCVRPVTQLPAVPSLSPTLLEGAVGPVDAVS